MSKNTKRQSRFWTSILHPLRDVSGRGFGPLLIGALVFTGVFFVARAYSEKLPVMRVWPGDQRDAVVFVDPRENVYSVHGDLENADLLIIGDSRVSAAIVAPEFKKAGLGNVAFIWCGAARFGALITIAENFPELPIVLAISPLSFGPEINEVIAEMNRKRHPGFDPNLKPLEVERWAETEREHLLALDMNEGLVELAIKRALAAHREMYERKRFSTANIDADLNRWVDWKRCEIVNPIRTQLFRYRWIDPPDERGSDSKYAWVLRPTLKEARLLEAEQTIARLNELPKSRELALVRLPISTSLRYVEMQRVGETWIDDLVEQTGRPYKDFGHGAYPTHDGSHLTWPGAVEFSGDLARWLKDDLGW